MPGLLKPAPTLPGSESLYKKRVKVFPKEVSGPYRQFKWVVLVVTLAIYYITPWLRWDRGPYAPDQAVLIDLAGRRFFFGPIEIWPQEFYYVAGLLIMAGIGLFLVTTAFGRAWCGYSCPQTVWTDLYMLVERWIGGDRNARMRLDKAPWGPEKIAKRSALHGIWLLIALVTGGAWVFYFADAPTLFRQIFNGTAPFAAYATIAVLTGTTYWLAGWMREQVCTYMCPWPRIQSAMLDEDSFIVTYKGWRGEKRGSVKAREADPAIGDCVDCMACVNVCPTGIDIRNGPQLECITCALCIDACNDVMDKLERPRDLIGYTTLKRDAAELRGEKLKPIWHTLLRPRILVYFALWAAIGLFMLVVLSVRERVDMLVSQDRNPLYVQLSDGEIRNGFTIKVINKEQHPREFIVTMEGLDGARLSDPLAGDTPAKSLRLPVAPDAVGTVHVQVRAPAASLGGEEHHPFTFIARAADGDDVARKSARFSGPAQ